MPLTEMSLSNLNAPLDQYTFDRTKYVLDAPYQRASVWTDEQRRNLIKSLFMGLPIGSVIVNFRGYDTRMTYVVVDGKQRIETLRAFVDDRFAVPADWFPADQVTETVPADESGLGVPGVRFSGLSDRYRRKFENFGIATLRAEAPTVADEAVLYGLINSGGTAHTDAELDKARTVAQSR